MDFKLKGKTALVTGSTSGIGRAIALQLLREGATVYVNGRDGERTAKAAEEISREGASGVKAQPAAGDASTVEGAKAIADAAGDVDILVNNAGIFEAQEFFDIPDEKWTQMFDVNVLSGIRMSRLLAPKMKSRGWGRIIFISSESGLNIPTEMVHYGMTKTCQLSVARGLAKVLSGSGVTVNSVLPGPTWTAGVEEFVEKMSTDRGVPFEQMREQFVPEVRPGSLIERFIQPEEVAALVTFLCSERAGAITGSAQRVEGGIVDTVA